MHCVAGQWKLMTENFANCMKKDCEPFDLFDGILIEILRKTATSIYDKCTNNTAGRRLLFIQNEKKRNEYVDNGIAYTYGSG